MIRNNKGQFIKGHISIRLKNDQCKKCEMCPNEFYVSPSGTKRFCSVTCRAIWTKENKKGEKSHNWKGGISKTNKECEFCEVSFIANMTDVRKGWGKYCSRSCRAKSKTKENSAHWLGGITPENKAIRNSTKYAEWRKSVFERDNFTCQQCFQHGGDLEADHIKRFADYLELRFELSNGRTLCRKCHRKTETYGSRKIELQYA